mmetsp:Transcript_42483/g.77082  ORF Transcript_42483/g.77082 Transcript_42483/m.77082 type:complete len:125 (-) Transcript_42483:79-453(-)
MGAQASQATGQAKPFWEEYCGPPLTIERLRHTVERMHVEEAKYLLERGVNVNEPLDQQGHTVMDVFLAEYRLMLEDAHKMSYARTDDANNFQRVMEHKGREMSELLRSYGAHRLSPLEASRPRK